MSNEAIRFWLTVYGTGFLATLWLVKDFYAWAQSDEKYAFKDAHKHRVTMMICAGVAALLWPIILVWMIRIARGEDPEGDE